MKKKIALLMLCALSAFFLVGCGPSAPDPGKEKPNPYVTPIIWEDTNTYSMGWKGPIELTDGTILSTQMNPGSPLSGQMIKCVASTDGGKTFKEIGTIASEHPSADFGDSAMVQLSDGTILCSYRYNRYNYPTSGKSEHQIRMSYSTDGGKTWEFHSVVSEHTANSPGYNQGEQRGLWSQYILETSRGDIQCYYDDENVCFENGYIGHQWWMMKTWNEETRTWENPVAVGRTNTPSLLARDGQGVVQEVAPGVLVTVFESVRTTSPHRGCVRMTVSTDYGATWNYVDANGNDNRKIVYVPEDENFSTLCPWLTILDGGVLMCTFMTDEDRETADNVASGVLDQSMKYCLSYDQGETWSDPYMLDERHPLWGPGVILLEHGENAGKVFYQSVLITDNGNVTVHKLGELNLPQE